MAGKGEAMRKLAQEKNTEQMTQKASEVTEACWFSCFLLKVGDVLLLNICYEFYKNEMDRLYQGGDRQNRGTFREHGVGQEGVAS